ncbi:PIN-like domain-containing protein [Psychrobacter sp. SWN149]|uniref:PIN-like domain-containing protein n=1 Tax=Psychrobacter sp. SWN149 TaxID=2792057 RepID=UPI0018CDCE18|nr:PIN-like domain-containing protein [Psychrobacter sp. SWN149]MBH0007687.1 hypothetical protein [Psychrobacter sp. SWN149]
MKEKFKVFYEPSEQDLSEAWSNSETIFIFDTNILLNLYHYSQETQDEFFKILNLIEDKVWIPFHVALEYQRRRLDVIKNEKYLFDDIENKLKDIKTLANNSFSGFKLKVRNSDLFEMEEDFKKEVCSLADKFIAEVNKADKAQPSVRTHDEIRAKLDDLLEGKIGEEPEQTWVTEVAVEGDTRYKNEVPPGYKDASKGNEDSKAVFIYNDIEYQRKFGDLIIWKQILEHLEKLDSIKNVIFITDDIKEDWWEIVKCDGSKFIGARTELKKEIYKKTGINIFKMYNSKDFVAAATSYCGILINDKAIEETKDAFDSLNTSSNVVEKYQSNNDLAANWEDILSAVEKYQADNDLATKWQGALSAVEKYQADNDLATKWQGALSAVEKYQSNNNLAANWQGVLDIMAKYNKDANKADIINKIRNNISNIDDLDDDQL